MKIGILGDTHGNWGWVKYALGKFKREGISTILQAGDFGIWPGEKGGLFARNVNNKLKENDQEMLVAPGNHEDWTKILSLPEYEDGWLSFRDNIRIAPRGHRWEMEGRSFVALGGAPSVDRAYRLQTMGIPLQEWKSSEEMLLNRPTRLREKQSWWPEEQITREDIEKTVAGGYADIFLAHDAPYGPRTITKNIAGNPLGFASQDLAYAHEGRLRMTEAWEGVKPALFIHGHYHFPVHEKIGPNDETFVVGLACDSQNYSMGSIDLETLAVDVWDIEADYRQYAR